MDGLVHEELARRDKALREELARRGMTTADLEDERGWELGTTLGPLRGFAEAKLRLSQACLEELDYSPRRELDKATMRQLATCRWVAEHHQALVTGATGTGKTFIACALAQQACRKGYGALYRRATRLFEELRLAHADGSYPRLLARFARMDVLVIDDLWLKPLDDHERHDLLEILEDRYGARWTIITSQLPPRAGMSESATRPWPIRSATG